METYIPQSPSAKTNKPGIHPVLLLLIAVLCGGVAAVLPLAYLVLPALLAYTMLRTKPAFAALPFGVFAGVTLTSIPGFTGVCLCVLCLLMTVALYWMQTHKMSNVYTLLALFGIGLLALYAAACMPGILNGEGAYARIQVAADEFVALAEEMILAMPEIPAQANATFTRMLHDYARSVTALVVPFLCMLAGALALSNLLFFRLFARKQAGSISPMRPFREWAIPQSMTYGMLFFLIASLVLFWMGWDYADALNNTVSVLVGMPLMLQGLCVVDYIIAWKGKDIVGRRVVTYLVLGVFIQFTQMILMVIGCFDQLFQFRKRASMMPPPFPPKDL